MKRSGKNFGGNILQKTMLLCLLFLMTAVIVADNNGLAVAEAAADTDNDTGFHGNSWRYVDGQPIAEAEIEVYNSQASDNRAAESAADNSVNLYSAAEATTLTAAAATSAATEITMRGIDISEFQNQINWQTVANSGIDFAVIRCGYETSADAYWKTNADTCTAIGMPFGVYLYSYASNVTEAKQEAQFVLNQVKGYNLSLPIYYDLEDSTMQSLGAAALGDIAETFCNTISAAGYDVGIYANLNWWENILTDSAFQNSSWDRWVAQYNSVCEYSGSYSMWQYSSKGSVDGISGNVDMNYWYGAFCSLSNSAPAAVKNLQAVAGSAAVKLSWNAVTGASGYFIYAKSAADNSYQTCFASGTAATVSGLENGVTYRLQVRAYLDDSSGNHTFGPYCAAVSATPLESEVSGLAALAFNQKVHINWNESIGAVGYYIYAMHSDGSLYKTYTTTKTTCNFTNLANGSSYSFKVRVYYKNSAGETCYGPYCTAVSATPYDDTVKNLKAAAYASKIKISWDTVTAADGYYIYAMYGDGSLYKTYATTKTSCNFTNLINGDRYQFKVRAYKTNTAGTRVYSTYSATVSEVPVLGTVSGLAAGAYNQKIRIYWDKATGADGYEIYAMYADGSLYKTYKTTKTYCNFTNLVNDDSYSFKVRAYSVNSAGVTGYGAYSSVVSAVPYAAVINNLTAAAYANKIKISWDEVAAADGYYIYAMYGDGSLYKTYCTAKSSCNFTNLVNGDTYQFKVRTYQADTAGVDAYGAYSAVVSQVPRMDEVSGLAALAFNHKVRINWEAADGAAGYYIYVQYADGSVYKTYSTAKTYCNFTNLTNDTSYYFTVRTSYQNSASETCYGEYCNSVMGTPYDDTVQNLQAVSSDSKIKISWDAQSAADGYYIYAMYGDGSLYKTYATTKITCNFTNLTNGTAYKFKVRAYKLDTTGVKVYSTYSATVSAVAGSN